jgi:hypothetical protein
MPQPDKFNNCLICGANLKYSQSSQMKKCSICGNLALSNAVCERGHFVCDSCHSYGALGAVIAQTDASSEKDPIKLFETVIKNPKVHMHGPEHHVLVPLVLITAYRNCGGNIDYSSAVKEIYKRAKQVPGGTCGYWGVCGAAMGAGIYASVITGSNPLNGKVWHSPMELTSACLKQIAKYGGPRCCKRTGRIAIEQAALYTKSVTGVAMPIGNVKCVYPGKNKECIGEKCPYFETQKNKQTHQDRREGEKKWNLSLKIKK